jgi:hypothetical protein
MPKNFNIPVALSLVSSPRMSSYQAIFSPSDQAELYGVYVWSQHAAASMYPLTQNAEISLRNSIDIAATSRFGKYWWRLPGFKEPGSELFQGNISSAQVKLFRAWEDKEKKRLKLRRNQPIPTPVPIWTHEQIIAATDFSTWQFILHDAFHSKIQATHKDFLWPLSMPHVFKQFSKVGSNVNTARSNLINLVKEIRDYRNRLFHHEPIWTKEPSVINARTAIDTVRKKINKIELLIETIDGLKLLALNKVGIFSFARRVCSEQELTIYRYANKEPSLTIKKKRILRDIVGNVQKNNQTVTWTYDNCLFGIYKIR